MITNLKDKQLLILDNDKEVESVNYKDGSAEYFLDLDNRTLGYLYQIAADNNQTVEQTIVNCIETCLDSYNDNPDFEPAPADLKANVMKAKLKKKN